MSKAKGKGRKRQNDDIFAPGEYRPTLGDIADRFGQPGLGESIRHELRPQHTAAVTAAAHVVSPLVQAINWAQPDIHRQLASDPNLIRFSTRPRAGCTTIDGGVSVVVLKPFAPAAATPPEIPIAVDVADLHSAASDDSASEPEDDEAKPAKTK